MVSSFLLRRHLLYRQATMLRLIYDSKLQESQSDAQSDQEQTLLMADRNDPLLLMMADELS